MPRSKRFHPSPPVGRISLATLPPFRGGGGGGGKSQTINQRQVLMQGSAQRGALVLPQGWVDGVQPPIHPPADLCPPSPASAASRVCQHSYFLGWSEKWSIGLGLKISMRCHHWLKVIWGFLRLTSQVLPGAARQGRVTLKKLGI